MSLRKFALCLSTILLVSLCAPALYAQDSAAPDSQTGTSAKRAQPTTSVTGCLQKGTEAGGYFIAGDDGKTWELSGRGLAAHVGHKITVTGHEVKRSKAEETKVEDKEKAEAGGKEYADLHVTGVKMISTSCSQ